MDNNEKKIQKASKLISEYVSYDFLGIEEDDETKNKINDIALLLKPNQWIRVEKETFNHKLNFHKTYGMGIKPNGIWASKGEWLFYSSPDSMVTLLEVDYSNILVLTTKKDYIKFEKNYCKLQNYGQLVKSYLTIDYKINHKKTKKNIDIPKPFQKYKNKQICHSLIDWNKVGKDYDGIAMVPNPAKFFRNKKYSKDHPNTYEHIWLKSYDVSSLVIWNQNNSKPIIKSIPLGTVQDFIENYKTLLHKIE